MQYFFKLYNLLQNTIKAYKNQPPTTIPNTIGEMNNDKIILAKSQ